MGHTPPDVQEEVRERMCESKVAYSKREAQEMLNVRSGRKGHRRKVNRNLRMYQCPFGPHWHLTDKPTR